MDKKNKIYRLTIGSPIEYNELVVYLEIDGKSIGLLQKEDGVLKFEFFTGKDEAVIDVDLLIEALTKAKQELMK